jgi:hypothetical protein
MDAYTLVGLAWVVVIVVGDWLVARWLRDDEEEDGERATRPPSTRGAREPEAGRTDEETRPGAGAAGASVRDGASRMEAQPRCAAVAQRVAESGRAAGSTPPPNGRDDDTPEAKP